MPPAATPAPNHVRQALQRLAVRALAKIKARRLKTRIDEEARRGVDKPHAR